MHGLTALRTGLRLGEILALRAKDVDLVRGHLMVARSITKGTVKDRSTGALTVQNIVGTQERQVPRGAAGSRITNALREHLRRGRELVFGDENGGFLNRDELKRIMPSAAKLAGVREVGGITCATPSTHTP